MLSTLSFTISAPASMFKDVELSYHRNRRGGLNLVYDGFMYTVERKYKSTTNWICNKNSNSTLRCPARCVTSDNTIKLGSKAHNHDPIK